LDRLKNLFIYVLKANIKERGKKTNVLYDMTIALVWTLMEIDGGIKA